MLSAQTRPRTEREEGCDFGVLRGRGGSPEKPERGQASGSTPALPLGTWGLQIRGAGSTAQPGEWRSGAQASPFPAPPGPRLELLAREGCLAGPRAPLMRTPLSRLQCRCVHLPFNKLFPWKTLVTRS